jgi:hypothetical protein
MNVTFTSGDKRVIRSVVNYFFNAQLTSDNIHKHVQYIGDKYKSDVTITKKDLLEKTTSKKLPATKMCIKLKR